jgi:hypothetical protein
VLAIIPAAARAIHKGRPRLSHSGVETVKQANRLKPIQHLTVRRVGIRLYPDIEIPAKNNAGSRPGQQGGQIVNYAMH